MVKSIKEMVLPGLLGTTFALLLILVLVKISSTNKINIQEGHYIEYADNVFKVIVLSDDREYIIVEDTLSKTFPLRLLKVNNYIKPVDSEIAEKYLELRRFIND